MKEETRTLTRLALLLIVIGFSYVLGYKTYRPGPEPAITTTVDSTSTVDSSVIEKPRPRDSTVIHHIYVKVPFVQDSADSVPATADSVPTSQDSALVDIPIERKVYQEDSLYRAVVSGYRVSLDSLTLFSKVTTITKVERVTKPAPKWSFGVTAGLSVLVTPSGQVQSGLGITGGVSYHF